MRDVRGWAAAMYHLSQNWHLGAGALYSRLLGDAADSPLVADRGSKNQWISGVMGPVCLVKLRGWERLDGHLGGAA